MALVAIYETEDKKGRLEIPIARVGKDSFLVTESGEHVEIENSLTDVYFGKLNYTNTVEIHDPLPRPVNHELRAAVAKFKTIYNSSFRSAEEERSFLASRKEIQAAYNNDFKDATIAQLDDWSNLVKVSVAAEEFNRYELTEKFRSPQCGDIRVDAPVEYGSKEKNGWDQTWAASCYKCGAKLVNIKASTILRMRRDRKTFKCGKPCKVQGGR